LLADIQDYETRHPADWDGFDNFAYAAVASSMMRGMDAGQVVTIRPFPITEDLSARVMLRTGLVAQPSYRGDLRDIADSKFKTRRSFCKATGLSEDMLSHFLAGRKELSLESLDAALRRIGYRVGVLPVQHLLGSRRKRRP